MAVVLAGPEEPTADSAACGVQQWPRLVQLRLPCLPPGCRCKNNNNNNNNYNYNYNNNNYGNNNGNNNGND